MVLMNLLWEKDPDNSKSADKLYAKVGYESSISANKEQQTAPNGLNDGTSGQGNGNPFSVLVGRNIGTFQLGVGYQVTEDFSLDAVYLHKNSCDALTGDCVKRSFVGLNTVFGF